MFEYTGVPEATTEAATDKPDYKTILKYLIIRMHTANIYDARVFCIDAAKSAGFCDGYDPKALYYYGGVRTTYNIIEPGTLDHLVHYLRPENLNTNKED